LIQKVLSWFIQLTPNTKRWFWKWWYNKFADRSANDSFRFMNYGYDADGFWPALNPEEESERFPIHLYHYVATLGDIGGKAVLEVGSGRGGGASYMAKYLNPSLVHGIDISSSAVALCNKTHQIVNLSFSVGDSENIPFDNNEFDIIINVESSHCYGNMDGFLSEVHRVLKPGGYFLWCDLRPSNNYDELISQFSNSGLDVIQTNDITQNIIVALEKMSDSRKNAIKNKVPFFIRRVFESYAGVEGSKIHNAFRDGTLMYLSAVLKKQE